MASEHRPLVVTAIVVDAVALALLGVAIAQTVVTGFLSSLLTGLVAIPIALAGAILGCIAVARTARRRRPVAITATVVLAITAVPLGLGALLVAGDFTVNPARDAVRAVAAPIEAAGGRRVCESGDPGFGPDNVRPWAVAIYEAPDDPRLEQRLRDRGTALGYDVRGTTPDIDAKRVSVSVTDGTADDTGVCSDGAPTAPAGDRLIRIDAAAPSHD